MNDFWDVDTGAPLSDENLERRYADYLEMAGTATGTATFDEWLDSELADNIITDKGKND